MDMPMTFYRCSHALDELNERFERLFKESDILMIEQSTNEDREKFTEYLNQISAGVRKEDLKYLFTSGEFDTYFKKIEGLLRGSGKRVEVENSPFDTKTIFEGLKELEHSVDLYFSGNLEEACNLKLKAYQQLASRIISRDEQLSEQLTNLQNENSGSSILMPIGASHNIHMKMGPQAKQEVPYKPYLFDYSSEVIRRIVFGRPVTKEMIARTLPEGALQTLLLDAGYPIRTTAELTRSVVENLSYADVNELSLDAAKNFSDAINANLRWLKSHGIIDIQPMKT